ncbi:MAG TPA: carboxypeptidase regulatory-like domain-containing protein [Blastocatellia bacterium]|nr:carboxypeptidase regulatory-like domain-containing protein [Blastocatellia bacterium]
MKACLRAGTQRLLCRLLVASVCVALNGNCIAAYAQQSVAAATLSGQVEDTSGAAISGATVTVTNVEQKQTAVMMSDDKGRYRFAYLPVGTYQLKVDAGGFTPLERQITLTVGQALDIPLKLAVAGTSESVSIAADVPVVETVRTQVAETLLPKEIDSLPLNGRNYLDLAALTPAVTRANPVANQRFAETSAVPGTQISIAGQRNINNGFVLDGLSTNDDAADLPGTFYSQEVIREFQVITAGGIAEFGRASSGVINVVSQSGTNHWRGRLYGFLRNRRTDARNPLAMTKDPLTQAQYGATLGGPIKHDHTFLFANFEQTRLHNAVVLTISPANVTAINRVLDQLNYTGPRISTGLAPAGYTTTNVFVRADHRINDANQLIARYSFYDMNSLNARGVGGLNAISRGTALADTDHTIALSEIATLSSKTTNEARFQFARSRLGAPPNDLQGPAITISGVANLGTSTSSPTERDLDLYEFVDNLNTVRAAHALKFGADFLYNRVNITFPGALQGVYTFSSLANLQARRYVTYQQAFGQPSLFQANPNVGFFAQDEWRIRPNLTVNAGLRYDVEFLPDPIQADTNNLVPRLGIAWSPGDRKTVIRASYGIYYERLPLRATSNALQRDGTKYKVASFAFGQAGAPVFPNVAAAFPVGFLPSITTIAANIENAYTQQASLQIERELTSNTSVSIGYLHARGLHLILSRNINVPTLSAADAARLGVPNLGRPNPNFANISRYESSGDSYYNGLLVSLNRRFKRWVGARLSYTYSKAIDDAGNAFFFTPQDNFNLRDDRGLSDNDQRHILAVSATLMVPESQSDSVWRRVVSGIQLNPIFRYGSALPFNIVTGGDRNNDTNVNDRPLGVARNSGKGFDYAALDLRLSKTFRFAERVRVEALVESFNTLNRANFQLPNATFGAGATPLASFGKPTAAADPRQIQFGLRVDF